ncbi:hypothetical protein [Ligilactobacillus murinus]|uniref:hypothetical protein n=1 Tax=Ligilactobacillus murinus TaxID=1622 RepID=UPI0007048E56|nr:hypothetical protein [Ligilactobacillus murinus]
MITAILEAMLLFATFLIHESFHYIVARLFGYNPKFVFSSYFSPTIIYTNRGEDLKNLCISLAGPLGTVIIGMLVPDIDLFNLFKIVCFLHLICLTPITADGQVILLSILNIVRGKV